jgi:outer membrane protein OmpA-like peptidoglycan-associated protein
MLLRILGVLGFVGLLSSGGGPLIHAEPTPQTDYEKTQSELNRLKQQYEDTTHEWRRAGQKLLPSLQSPLIDADALPVELPPECIAHLQEEKAKLERDAYNNEAWLQHVFKCDMCCAPLLASILEQHVAHVIANPHLVILFDFVTSTLHENYPPRLDDLMRQFDPVRDQVLLIGRASRTGDRAYNIALSGKRAGEIKDYLIGTHAVGETQISILISIIPRKIK